MLQLGVAKPILSLSDIVIMLRASKHVTYFIN